MEHIGEITAKSAAGAATSETIATAAGVNYVARSGVSFVMVDGRSRTTHEFWTVKWPIKPMSDEQSISAVIGLLRAGHDVCVNDLWLHADWFEELSRDTPLVKAMRKRGGLCEEDELLFEIIDKQPSRH